MIRVQDRIRLGKFMSTVIAETDSLLTHNSCTVCIESWGNKKESAACCSHFEKHEGKIFENQVSQCNMQGEK